MAASPRGNHIHRQARAAHRIRIINAGADTAFRVALAGAPDDGHSTRRIPRRAHRGRRTSAGYGERYDVIVTAGDGVSPGRPRPKVRTPSPAPCCPPATGSAPDAAFRPPELTRLVGTVDTFTATPQVQLPTTSDLDLQARLSGTMARYDWAINGRPYDQTIPLTIHEGQHATLAFANNTMMWHPMHLHGPPSR